MKIHENLELENLVIDGEKEIWVRLNEVEELSEFRDWYWISSFGRVKSIRGSEKILKQRERCSGYLLIGLATLDGKPKKMYVHRLVCFVFVSGYKDGLVCNHLDENSKNNHYSNLEWCTQKKNANHGTRNERVAEKLAMPVIGICIKTGEVVEFDSTHDAGRSEFSQSAVASACRGEYASQNKHGGTNVYRGYRWSYVESA